MSLTRGLVTTAMGYIIVVVNSVRDFRHRRRPSTASRTLFIASSLTAFTDSQKQPRYDHTCCASLPAQLPAHSFQAGWLTGWLAAGWPAPGWLAGCLAGWLAGIQWSPWPSAYFHHHRCRQHHPPSSSAARRTSCY